MADTTKPNHAPEEFHLDYETRSRADLKTVGAYRYAEDTSTRILMFAISTNTEGPYLYVPQEFDKDRTLTHPKAEILIRRLSASDNLVWAHNAQFEAAISRYRLATDVGVKAPALERWRCTAALCRRAALPPSLDRACTVLGLDNKKDKAGAGLIRLFSQPRKDGTFAEPADHREKFIELCNYCLQDVRTEKDLHAKLKPFEMHGSLLDMFKFDVQLNDFGIPVHVPALENAQRLIEEIDASTGVAFRRLTGLNPSQRAKVQSLMKTLEYPMKDMKADTVEAALEKLKVRGGKAYEVLKLYSTIQYSAVKKVKSMLDCVCTDGRVRGTLQFYGAGTGRWAGRLIQPQNFKKPTIKHTDIAYSMIVDGCTLNEFSLLWEEDHLEVIASCIRHFICGPFINADYNAIEARIVCWLAGQEDVLDMYRQGRDLYKYMAGRIYGKPEASIVNPSEERELGKRTILGCGFNMGGEKFQSTCEAQYGIKITRAMADLAVTAYRERCWKVAALWGQCDKAARNAIAAPGQVFKAGELIRFVVRTINGVPFLCMRLPSGRNIVYPWPKLELVEKHGRSRENITFYGHIKGAHWGRVGTYGGKLVENATQGTAADVMGNGAVTATQRGFKIVTLIHDEAPAVAGQDQTVEQYCAALTTLPEWAKGLPIKAEGKIIPYYKK